MLPDLTLPGHPEIFAIGDMTAVHQHASQAASMPDGESGTTTLPGVAPVAIQQGRYVADAIRRRLNGQTVEPFKYHDKGSMATIGRAAAVADLGWVWLSGYLAWLVWLFVHLAYLIQFQNRILVMVQWAWNYFTRNRSARLITGPSRPPESRGD